MRIGLINEGTYPLTTGGVSSWCDRLFRGLPEHRFHVLTLTGGGTPSPVWELPDNVGYSLHPLWGKPPAQLGSRSRPWTTRFGRARRRRLDDALTDLWASVLDSTEDSAEPDRALPAITRTLQAVAELAGEGDLSRQLGAQGSTYPILRAWASHRAKRPGLPELTLADAARAARLADSALRAMDASWPEVDVIHCAASGPSALAGLARHWARGTPMVLTEHGVYLRERYLALHGSDFGWNVRYLYLAFLRAVTQVANDTATLLSPVSEFNARWERRLGTTPGKIVVIHNGVDEDDYPIASEEPEVPTVSFVGRIDPLKDIRTLVDAFALILDRLPHARLRLFGPTPAGNAGYRAEIEAAITEHGIGDSVSFEGPVSSSRIASEAGHVVALSSISEGLPFTVMEAMFVGRATVNTDVGGVSEVVGADGVAGVVVPPRDPQAMAAQLLRLLVDDTARRAMGRAARERALRMFTLDTFVTRHRALYEATQTATSDDIRRLAESAPRSTPIAPTPIAPGPIGGKHRAVSTS